MSVRSESWSRPADAATAATAALLALAVFLVSWGALHRGFYTRDVIVDTPVYHGYGDAMADGEIPYRDFRLEYPPAALPAFALPSLGNGGDLDAFTRRFELLMAACGAATIALLALLLGRLGASPARLAAALLFVAAAPLAVGSVVLSRYDLWPAALTAAALAALVALRFRLGLAVLGLAVAAKLYPGVLLPLALAFVWRRAGRREALVCGGVFAAVVAACFVPLYVLDPGGVLYALGRQASGTLQTESPGSAVLLAAHHAVGAGLEMKSSHGSQNLTGPAAVVLAALLSGAQLAALAWTWIAFARGPAGRERLLLASAAAACAFVALGKVLSPQFLIWLVPLVPLVRGRRGLLASALLALALVLTQAWFPFRYWDLALEFDAVASWLVVARDLVLVALLAVLVTGLRPAARGTT